MVYLKLIWSAIRRERWLYVLWTLSLSGAVCGLVIIDIYRASLTFTLNVQGQKILSADAAVSSRRKLLPEERASFMQTLPPNTRWAENYELFAMVSSPKSTRLALLKFIDDNYPLIGDLFIEQNGAVDPVHGEDLGAEPNAWVAEDFLILLNTKVGDKIKVGSVEFVIKGVISKDSSQTFRFGNVAPRIYLSSQFLDQTQLVQFGSTFSHTLFAALNPAENVPDLKKKLEQAVPDSTLRITVPTDLEQGSLRVLSRLLDYLGLIGLVTLTLGWIGVYYLGRRWLMLEHSNGGLLKCLGFTSTELQNLWLGKLGLILGVGVSLGGTFAWSGAHLVFPMLAESLPSDFQLIWSWKNTLLLMLIGPAAGVLLLLMPIRSSAFTKPLHLMGAQLQERSLATHSAILVVILIGLFTLLTFLQARSWMVTGLFLAGMLGSVTLAAALAWAAIYWLFKKYHKSAGWLWHLCTALWWRRRGTTVLLVTISALSGLLAQVVPHLEKTLVGELRAPTKINRPALFLFDIQDDQLPELKTFLNQNQIEISQTSPFIRARLLQVNNQAFERAETTSWSTREEETEARFRNRGVNLTYREDLSPSESILSGKKWQDLSVDPPEISVEEGYAKRLRLAIGDRLLMDIQGVEITATIASVRKINWDSFEPNFFLQLRPGILEEAPKTWIMTVQSHSTLNPAQIQMLVASRFANVTSINVQETIANVSEVMTKLSSGLKIASALSLALGVFVFMVILLFQLMSSHRDWRELSVLGLSPWSVAQIQWLAYGGLCMAGTILGGVMSLGLAWGLARFGFESSLQLDVWRMLQVFMITWLVAGLGLFWLSHRQDWTRFKSFNE